MAVLAIDVGTGSVRAAVVDRTGRFLSVAHEPAGGGGPSPLLDPETVWASVARVVRQAVAEAGVSPAAAGVSAQLGWLGLGAKGAPLTPVMTWAHQEPEAGLQLVEALGHEALYRVAGRRISAELPVAKWRWMARQDRTAFNRIHAFVSLKDYLLFKLSGAVTTDLVHACYTGLFNVTERCWSRPLAEAADLPGQPWPEAMEPGALAGHLSAHTAGALGLTAGIPVITGGPDGTMAALGAGVIQPGLAVDVMGTTDVFLTCVDRPVFDPSMRILLNCHPLPGLWMAGGTLGTTGGCQQWYLQGLAQGLNRDDLELTAENVPRGSRGLIALVELTGSRSPDWDPHARGALVGFSPAHGPAEIYRAILEGGAFALRRVHEVLEAAGLHPTEVRAIGGGARSGLALRIRADMLGCLITRPATEEATTLGTAMLALVAAGEVGSVAEAVGRMVRIAQSVEPTAEGQRAYQERFRTYRTLTEALGPIWPHL